MYLHLILLLSFMGAKPIDELRYDVLHNGKTVGEFKAYMTVDGVHTTYVNSTDIKAKIVAAVRVNVKIQSTYKNNELEHSKVNVSVNGKPYSSSLTKRVGNQYQFYKDDKLKSTLVGPIMYSAALMMFKEPSGIAAAYSEEGGSFHAIEKSVANVYEKLNSRGRKSIYHYKNQILKSMDMDVGLTTIEMVRKD